MRIHWLALGVLTLSACSTKAPLDASLALGAAPTAGSPTTWPMSPAQLPGASPTVAPSAAPAPLEVGVLVAQGRAQSVRVADARTGAILPPRPQPLWLGPSQPHVSRDGHYLVYATDDSFAERLVLYDLHAGAEVPLPHFAHEDAREPDLDADGGKLVYIAGGPLLTQVAIYDRATDQERVLAIPKKLCLGAREPTISGDGRVVAFVADSARGDPDIVVVDVASGRPLAVPDLNTVYDETEPSLSADGKTLLFVSDRGGSKDLFAIDVASGRYSNTAGLNSFADETWPRFVGPHDDTIAYFSNATGAAQLVAQPFTGR